MNMVDQPGLMDLNNVHGDEDEGVYLNTGVYTIFRGALRQTLTVADNNCFLVTHSKYMEAVKSAQAVMGGYGFDTTGFTPQQILDTLLELAFVKPTQGHG